ncbi:alpha/beta-hydrolase [Hyphopichia burtonii NRRL Y-1933]|uniref:Alpha/beta-hydrolase n=1 Tax=Hyphopichia burtonii NRRL Y-1933 TaxID=984485 RepID=A0A1E4RG21_9ASCO|nr:alpha/beta-hydrolase [Hyphopichia burtonii NRRL Y-1933]ODV66085.1 alpha/beta-hydrolase [Hyphopichia burtonii NRRL Y-1933]
MSQTHEAVNPIHPSMVDKLDPEFVKLYDRHVANTPNKPIDLATLRENYDKIYSYGTASYPTIQNIEEITFASFDGADIKLRIYRPNGTNLNEKLPVHIDFHGGGGGLGSLNTEEHILCHYVELAKIAIVDVDYRLVPDYKFPTYIKDCFEATKYVYENSDKLGFNNESLSIGGVSVGGNIAFIVSHLCRDAKIPLVLCLAGTPQVDDVEPYYLTADSPYESSRECEFAPTLNWARITFFDKLKWQHLSKDPEKRSEELKEIGWFKSVMNAPDFSNLPKTVVATAGCDPMRDEGEAYACKLIQNGNEVVFKRYPGVPHPFMHMDASLLKASDYIRYTAHQLVLAHKTK